MMSLKHLPSRTIILGFALHETFIIYILLAPCSKCKYIYVDYVAKMFLSLQLIGTNKIFENTLTSILFFTRTRLYAGLPRNREWVNTEPNKV